MINAKTWNPAQIDQSIRRLEGIIRSGSYNPAELNQLLNQLGEPGYINTWNPAELDQKLRTLLHDLLTLKTETGNPILLRTNNGGLVQSCEVTFSPIQDLHGQDAPYPAGGGKNKLDKADSSASANSTWLNEDCNLPAGTYTFSFKSSAISGQCTFNVFDSNGDRIYQAPSSIQLASTVTHTFTISSDGARVSSYINVASNISEVMIEVGSTKTDFAPYSNICPISGWTELNLYQDTEQTLTPETTHTATFPDTVYGGSYEFVSGTGLSNMKMLDLGSKTWTKSTSYTNPFFYTGLTNEEAATLHNEGICEYYAKFIPPFYVDGEYFGKNAPNNTFAINTTYGKQIYIRDDNYTDAADFKTAMSGVYLCYELATPTEITLTPEEIELLTGDNVLWTDGDNIEITYKKLLLPSDVESLSKIKKIKEKPKTKRSKKKKEE